MNLAEKESCTGCGACTYVCPKKCISFRNDETYDIAYPIIDEEQCISCGKCQKFCPALNPVDGVFPSCAYAAWSADSEERRTSASGGIATEIYKHALNKGCSIVGASFCEDFKVRLELADSLGAIDKFKNSKYVFSYTDGIFYEIAHNLKDGNKVAVVALPCQIASIKKIFYRYLDNLLLVDLVCHGVTPSSYLIQHIKSIEREKGDKAVTVFFRDPAYSTDTFTFTLYNAHNHCIYAKRTANRDSYQVGYHRMISYRENCYHCRYAKPLRISDITISDYKGLGKYAKSSISDNRHVSCILINSDKGRKFVDGLINDGNIVAEKRPVQEPIDGDGQLRHPSLKSFARKIFERRMSFCKGNFERAIYPVIYIVSFQRFFYRLDNLLKRIILKFLKPFRI